MTDINIKDVITPLSSRMIKSKSIPLLFQKINTERKTRKREMIKYSFLDHESPSYSNLLSFNRNISSSCSINSGKGHILNSNDFHENIYQDLNIINSNSIPNNISKIKQMIKEKKYKNYRNLYNMFFNSPFPSEQMNELSFIKKNKLFISKRNNNWIPIKRNNSCEMLINATPNIRNVIQNDEYTPRLSTNFSKVLNTHLNIKKNSQIPYTEISKKKLKYNISNLSTTTNKSIINKNIPSNLNIFKNEDSFNNSQSNIILPKITNLQSQNSNPTESENLVSDIQKDVGSFLTE